MYDVRSVEICDPLLMYPLEPLVLVEGKFDRDFLAEYFRIASPARVPEFRASPTTVI
jgi:hypothetical protein